MYCRKQTPSVLSVRPSLGVTSAKLGPERLKFGRIGEFLEYLKPLLTPYKEIENCEKYLSTRDWVGSDYL